MAHCPYDFVFEYPRTKTRGNFECDCMVRGAQSSDFDCFRGNSSALWSILDPMHTNRLRSSEIRSCDERRLSRGDRIALPENNRSRYCGFGPEGHHSQLNCDETARDRGGIATTHGERALELPLLDFQRR